MSVVSVRSALLDKLNDMQTLKAAYDWETSNESGNYPYATITIRRGIGEFRSTAQNFRRRGYTIRVYQERSKAGQGSETAEDIAASVIDELETAFDDSTTLSGACKYVEAIDWTAAYIDRETDARILEIAVDAIELVRSQR